MRHSQQYRTWAVEHKGDSCHPNGYVLPSLGGLPDSATSASLLLLERNHMRHNGLQRRGGGCCWARAGFTGACLQRILGQNTRIPSTSPTSIPAGSKTLRNEWWLLFLTIIPIPTWSSESTISSSRTQQQNSDWRGGSVAIGCETELLKPKPIGM